MAASVVQICNVALHRVGNLSITALTDNTKEGRACNVLYPLMRNEILTVHPWNFAMARADISASLAATPAFEWDYAYTLPVDCLRVWELYGTDDEWVREGNELLTNKEEEIYIRYIKLVTDSAMFSPVFDNCLSMRLASELAGKLADDKNLRASLMQELVQIHLPNAYMINSFEGNRPLLKGEQPLDTGNFTWQTEGR
jgi:hypothetical protein